jgi:hypothetical protein
LAKRPNFWRRADDEDYVTFEEQQDLYEKWTGDRPAFLGFDRRFAEWCVKHPRNHLRSVNDASERTG